MAIICGRKWRGGYTCIRSGRQFAGVNVVTHDGLFGRSPVETNSGAVRRQLEIRWKGYYVHAQGRVTHQSNMNLPRTIVRLVSVEPMFAVIFSEPSTETNRQAQGHVMQKPMGPAGPG